MLSQGGRTGQRFEPIAVEPLPGTEPLDWGHLALYELAADPVTFRDAWAAFVPSGRMTPVPEGVQRPLICILLTPDGPEHPGPESAAAAGGLADQHLLLGFGPPPSQELLARLADAPGLIRAQRLRKADAEGFPGVSDGEVTQAVVYELAGDPRPFRDYLAAQLATDAAAATSQAMFLEPVSGLALA